MDTFTTENAPTTDRFEIQQMNEALERILYYSNGRDPGRTGDGLHRAEHWTEPVPTPTNWSTPWNADA